MDIIDKIYFDFISGQEASMCIKILFSIILTGIFIVGILHLIQMYCDHEQSDKFCQEYGHLIVRETNNFLTDIGGRLHFTYKNIRKIYE